VSPVKYELGFYIPEDDILHSHCRENLKSYNDMLGGYLRTWLYDVSLTQITAVMCGQIRRYVKSEPERNGEV
jgi:hypothetical protein